MRRGHHLSAIPKPLQYRLEQCCPEHKSYNRHHDRNIALSHACHHSENKGKAGNDHCLRQRGIIKDVDDFIQRTDYRQKLDEVQNTDDIENNFYPRLSVKTLLTEIGRLNQK